MSVVLSTYNSGGHCPGETRGIYFKYQVIDDSMTRWVGFPLPTSQKLEEKKSG